MIRSCFFAFKITSVCVIGGGTGLIRERSTGVSFGRTFLLSGEVEPNTASPHKIATYELSILAPRGGGVQAMTLTRNKRGLLRRHNLGRLFLSRCRIRRSESLFRGIELATANRFAVLDSLTVTRADRRPTVGTQRRTPAGSNIGGGSFVERGCGREAKADEAPVVRGTSYRTFRPADAAWVDRDGRARKEVPSDETRPVIMC